MVEHTDESCEGGEVRAGEGFVLVRARSGVQELGATARVGHSILYRFRLDYREGWEGNRIDDHVLHSGVRLLG